MGNLPNITYIDSYINDGNNSVLSLSNFYDTHLIGDIDKRDHIFRIPINDFFVKYRQQLQEIVQQYNVPDRYFYQPKTLSLDLYGTTEMWLGLLRLNGMKNITEFRQSIIDVYNPVGLRELINVFFKRERKIT
jgi:hypothetical protein